MPRTKAHPTPLIRNPLSIDADVKDEPDTSDSFDSIPDPVDVEVIMKEGSFDDDNDHKRERQRRKTTYTEDTLQQALEAMKEGMPINQAAKVFLVPISTLKNRKLKPVARRAGADTILTADEEKILEKWLDEAAELGDPKTSQEIPKAAFDLAKILNKPGFKSESGLPSKNWVKSFKIRHPTISTRKYGADMDFTGFNKNFRSFLERRGMLEVLDRPDAFYVIEDTNFDFNNAPPNSTKRTQLRQMMAKNLPGQENFRSKESATVIYTFNVNGLAMQPLMIFRNNSVDLYEVAETCRDLENNLIFSTTSDGGPSKQSFKAYLERLDVELKKVQRPIFVFCSETFPPVDFETFQTLKQKQIFVISYIPKEVSVLRTCSEEIFGMNNTGWSEIVKSMSVDGKISAINFVKALIAINRNYLVKSSIEEGFRKAGIYPFDDVVESEDFEPPSKIRRIEVIADENEESLEAIREVKKAMARLKEALVQNGKLELIKNLTIMDQQLQLMENSCGGEQ